MGESALVAAIELGGTKCIAAIARGRDILNRERWPTRTPAETLPAILDWIAEASAGEPLAAVGVAGFGPLVVDPTHADYGKIGSTPKPHWSGFDLRGAVVARFAVPIGFDTDVAGAALAEGRWGAARGCGTHIYVTIGTGVGAGIAVAGKPLHGAAHPEVGHIRVRRDPTDAFAGACPFHGDCLEGLVSGPAIAARAGMPAEQLASNDPLWDRIADEIAELVMTLMLTVPPQRIVIGGGVGSSGRLLPRIRATATARLAGYGPGSDAAAIERLVVSPGLGADAGPLGAVALALAAVE
ncbi:ROK family protein [Sphingomonas sp. H39-1-10]|uniref:ROK family protein n=1 Tax=Sphingomonas TaxID=13687 RepID=UPI000886E7BB|nr:MULTISPECIES: ROK family protein [Sphingomonas]MDF0487975.1 ROK family protein [Sphingomonas pollutisoli]SDA24198.1 fructokinase [Sphingomonas sp. NFR15]